MCQEPFREDISFLPCKNQPQRLVFTSISIDVKLKEATEGGLYDIHSVLFAACGVHNLYCPLLWDSQTDYSGRWYRSFSSVRSHDTSGIRNL